MINKILFYVCFIFCFSPALVFADLCFEWDASLDQIDGYKLYQDSLSNLIDGSILATETTVCMTIPTDGLSHMFFLTTYDEIEESGKSEVIYWYSRGTYLNSKHFRGVGGGRVIWQ